VLKWGESNLQARACRLPPAAACRLLLLPTCTGPAARPGRRLLATRPRRGARGLGAATPPYPSPSPTTAPTAKGLGDQAPGCSWPTRRCRCPCPCRCRRTRRTRRAGAVTSARPRPAATCGCTAPPRPAAAWGASTRSAGSRSRRASTRWRSRATGTWVRRCATASLQERAGAPGARLRRSPPPLAAAAPPLLRPPPALPPPRSAPPA
jgi:hypothetical protein